MARMPVEERRQQLVDAAIRVMTRDGVTSATTRAISSEAGLSLSVFHYCFASKQDLLDAVIRQLVETTVDHAEASFTPRAAPFVALPSCSRVGWPDTPPAMLHRAGSDPTCPVT